MRALFVSAALVIALAGCGKQDANQADGANASAGDAITNYQQAVIDLSEGQRNGVFFRAIHDAGLPCQQVVNAERVTNEKEGPAWRAQCEDKSYHLIIVHADGTAKVVSRTQ